jgi:hypothetical protein
MPVAYYSRSHNSIHYLDDRAYGEVDGAQTGVFERVVNIRYRVGAEICRGLASGLLPTVRPTRKSRCAPSAQGMQALPAALVVGSPILECHAGPGAFIAETLRCPGQVKRLVCRALLAISLWLLLPVSAVSRIDSPSPEVLVVGTISDKALALVDPWNKRKQVAQGHVPSLLAPPCHCSR